MKSTVSRKLKVRASIWAWVDTQLSRCDMLSCSAGLAAARQLQSPKVADQHPEAGA